MSLQRLMAALAALILLLCFAGAALAEDSSNLILSLPDGIAYEEDGAVRLDIGVKMRIGVSVGSGYSVSFKSSNKKVAAVDGAGVVKGLKNGRANISVTARDYKGVIRANQTLAVRVYTPLNKLTLPAQALVLTGNKKRLIPSFSPSTASDKVLTWHSADENVATVAKDGTVTAVSPGFSTITAIGSGGLSASCALRVTDPAKMVEIDAPTGERYLHHKKSLQLRATVRPETAFEGVTWRSSNPKVVKVDANGRAYGKKPGTAKVYATAKDGSGVKGVIRLQVITPITGVKLAPTEKVLAGRSKKLTVKFSPSKPSVKALKWTSSDERIAVVSPNGTVTGREPGEAVITCETTDGSGKSASCVLMVARPVEAISIRPENGHALVYKGEKVRLVADVHPEDAFDQSLKWSSSNKARAKVDPNGVVVGVRPGKVKITARAKDGSGKAQSINLIVGAPAKDIRLNKQEAVIYINGGTDDLRSVRLSVKALPSGASFRKLEWKVTYGDSVTVDGGVVTAVREGVATVQATIDDRYGATCRVTVLRLPDVLALGTNAVTLVAGQSFDLGGEVIFDGACTERTLTWSSKNSSVASVSKEGVVKAAKGKTGVAKIEVTSKNALKATCIVTVVKSLPKSKAAAAQEICASPEEAMEPESGAPREPVMPPDADAPEGEQGTIAPKEAQTQDGGSVTAPGVPQETDAETEIESAVIPPNADGPQGEG